MMNLKRLIWKLFSIQGDELRFVLPLFFLYFLSGSFFSIGQIFTETIFLKSYGAKAFSGFFIQNGIALIISGIIYNYFLLKTSLKKGYVYLICFFSLLILGSIYLVEFNYAWLPFYLYMANYLFTTILDMHFFNFAFMHLSIRNSKRILPVLMGGGKLGGMLCSFLIFMIFSKDIEKYGMIFWAANGVMLFLPILFLNRRRFPSNEKSNVKSHELLPDITLVEKIIKKFRFTFSSDIFLYSALTVLTVSVLNQITEFYFARIFNNIFTSKNELSAFLSLYTLSADFITVILQLFIISKLINRLGVAKSNYVYPVSFTAFIAFTLFFPGLAMASLLRFHRKNMSYIIRMPVFNVIMAASPKDRMTEVKSFLSGIVSPAGMIIGGWIIHIIYGKLTLLSGYSLSIALGAFCVLCVYLQNSAYIRTLKHRLSSDASGSEEEERFDLIDYAPLFEKSEDIKSNLKIAEVFFNERPGAEYFERLSEYYDELSSETKENMLKLLMTEKAQSSEQILLKAVNDPDKEIRAVAFSVLQHEDKTVVNRIISNQHIQRNYIEEYAVNHLLEDIEADKDSAGDLIEQVKGEVMSFRLPVEDFLMLISVLPEDLYFESLLDMSLAMRDKKLLKKLVPLTAKLTERQITKIIHSFRFAPPVYLAEFIANCGQISEMQRLMLLDYAEFSENIKDLFVYDDKVCDVVLKRLLKNISYFRKSNYLKLILVWNKIPENEIRGFIEYEIACIRNLAKIRSLLQSENDGSGNILPKFLDKVLHDYVELHKHLIMKAIGIISGMNIDEIYDSTIFLNDKDLNNYILEYIESSVRHSRDILPLFDTACGSAHERTGMVNAKLTPEDLLSLHTFIPELSQIIKFCVKRIFGITTDVIIPEANMLSLIEKIVFLGDNKLFSELKVNEIIHIAKIARELEIPAGKIIINQGETGAELFIIVTGEVKVYTQGKTLANLGAGACIGELSIVDEEPRSANVMTTQASRMLSISRKDFLLTLKENPAISINIMRVITGRLRGLIGV